MAIIEPQERHVANVALTRVSRSTLIDLPLAGQLGVAFPAFMVAVCRCRQMPM
ncbi:MAG: hypothetical protein OXK76_05935 [Gammaproteobacteria bacterium]|nr:hypothetical protein [Gammaproteobacteria bacterium]